MNLQSTVISVIIVSAIKVAATLNCPSISQVKYSFVRSCQRSTQKVIDFANTASLADCIEVARSAYGMALNYAPVERRRRIDRKHREQREFDKITPFNYTNKKMRLPFWQIPEEYFNCHVLECPENATFASMINDDRYDYFSLYGQPTEFINYSCISGVGLFYIDANPQTYLNASNSCSNSSEYQGNLAHIASYSRTLELSKLLTSNRKDRIHKAYVGLHFNRTAKLVPRDFVNAQNESIRCFPYRAWAPNYPYGNGILKNVSCVALTSHRTWINEDCKMKLPFICEIFTSNSGKRYEGERIGRSSICEKDLK